MPEALVVDDDESNLRLAQILLEDAGWTVTPVTDSQSVFLHLENEDPPDAILLDIRLRNTTGTQHLPAVRALAPHTPIIAVTAHARPEDRGRFLREGFDGYIPKPLDVETFAETIEGLVRAKTKAIA